MSSTDAAPATAETGGREREVVTLAEQLPRFMRLVQAAKAQRAAEGRDRAALVLLYPIGRLGPLRQSEVAELVHADPSTVSRHVADLIERGMVRRVPDETDGRASRLLMTDIGAAALAELCAERNTLIADVTASWTDDDLATFTTLFARLLDDLAAVLPGSPTPPSPREPR